MGEMSKSTAITNRDNAVGKILFMKKQIRRNFENMDFANANKRTEYENTVTDMEKYIDTIISRLENLEFE